ncbi:MAG: apolipoprotein N-acyltransferase [Mailhella sp.]|nr:apolipoprotein N-acyltransferase [Mailhella sp.]
MTSLSVLSSAVLACAASFGLFFGTANTLLHIPYAILLYPAALYAIALRSRAPFRLGWIAGTPGAAACLYWIAVAAHKYGGFPWILAVPCSVLLGMYVSLWGGLFAWIVARMDSLPVWRRAASAGLLWMLLEWTRGWFCTGFPWLPLSAGLAAWPVLLQPLSLIGAYGYSGLLAAAACLACEALGVSEKKTSVSFRAVPALAAAVILTCSAGFGFWHLSSFPEKLAEQGTPVSVAMVQGNVRQDVKWTPEYQLFTMEKYLRLSTEAIRRNVEAVTAQGRSVPSADGAVASMGASIGTENDASLSPILPDFLLWPETAMPFAYPGSQNSEELRRYVRTLGIPLVFGAPGVEYEPGVRKLFNRSFLLTAEGDAGHYDKEHLVPFGEYLPPVLDWKIFEPLLQGLGGFTAGGEDALFLLEPKGRPEVPMGMLICYEAIFPELARQRVADGAQLLLNISNDAWYDFTAAPMQHLHLSLMRAVEQGRWVARATNSGITAFLDPLGGIHAMGAVSDGWALFKDGVLAGTVLALRGHTPYFYAHPWLPGLAAIMLAALCLPLLRTFRLFRRKER